MLFFFYFHLINHRGNNRLHRNLVIVKHDPRRAAFAHYQNAVVYAGLNRVQRQKGFALRPAFQIER